ncbi:hypothetical protein DNTS_009786 [Danionella cerebrum]|uniref:Uncharacterized protein n=1 Tax=Danionella cerebrum TaxID=2873325 RepID=A0A553QGJ7_9TELE|nr:hypothetical protein DNTS_009786 [Danionella translucida]
MRLNTWMSVAPVLLSFSSEAAQTCAQIQCDGHQRCCAQNSSTSTVHCCPASFHSFLDTLEWMIRRLSGLLILLLLFVVGYFIQRLVCPRTRRQSQEEPALLNGHPSQDSLAGGFCSPELLLPKYEEVRNLPTYEEIMMEDSGAVFKVQ